MQRRDPVAELARARARGRSSRRRPRRGRAPRRRARSARAGGCAPRRRCNVRYEPRPTSSATKDDSVAPLRTEDAAVVEDALHPDRLVEPRSPARSRARTNSVTVGVVSSSSRTGRAAPARAVALPARRGIDPDLLQLHRARRPRRRLRLEQHDAVLDPDPRAPLVDLRRRAPAKAVGVARQRVDAELERVRGRARGHEHVEIAVARRPQPALARRRRLRDRVDRLARTILSRPRQPRRAPPPTARRPRPPRR